MDLDVALGGGKIKEDFRLKAGLPTLRLCLEHAQEVIVMGHLGRPGGVKVPHLSVEPIYDWLMKQEDLASHLEGGKLKLLENLRFEKGEEEADFHYAQKLADLGDVFVNEAFAAHHISSSTTVLPTLLPHAAGLRFFQEVEVLTKVRENPGHPLVIIIGGVKVEDKLPAVKALASIADYVLVGGRIAGEVYQEDLGTNVVVGRLNQAGDDLTEETINSWAPLIKEARMIVWNGPVGKVGSNVQCTMYNEQKGTYQIAQLVAEAGAESIVGGGDTVGFLNGVGFLDKFNFISTGGGAMLKFLEKGTLPAIKALN